MSIQNQLQYRIQSKTLHSQSSTKIKKTDYETEKAVSEISNASHFGFLGAEKLVPEYCQALQKTNLTHDQIKTILNSIRIVLLQVTNYAKIAELNEHLMKTIQEQTENLNQKSNLISLHFQKGLQDYFSQNEKLREAAAAA